LLSIDRRSFQNFDWLLLFLMLLLTGIGLVNLLSATQAGTEGGLPSEFRRQLVALALASIALIAALLFDYRRTERLALPFYLATLLLCASTLVFAPVVRGSRSWLLWGPLSLQPAELRGKPPLGPGLGGGEQVHQPDSHQQQHQEEQQPVEILE
jgi:rod shape determining protein RodA